MLMWLQAKSCSHFFVCLKLSGKNAFCKRMNEKSGELFWYFKNIV